MHDEPFYAVMGFAPTDDGLGMICRVSQKQVVNVAQHGGLARACSSATRRADLRAPCAPPRARATQARDAAARATIQKLRDLDGVIGLLDWDEETYLPAGGARAAAARSSHRREACGTSCSRRSRSAT